MKIALISSELGTHCGIAEHTCMLIDAVIATDPATNFQFHDNGAWLDPDAYLRWNSTPDVLHLNYHRGLHSRWTPERLRSIVVPTVITFHDTYETQPDRLPWDFLDLPHVRAMVVHEPCDLCAHPKVMYLPQPCPNPTGRGASVLLPTYQAWRPLLGTLGFDFPWKNYDMLATVTAAVGWGLLIVGSVSADREAELRTKNPDTFCPGYTNTRLAVAYLSACSATAFVYTCANSGTSAAIRVGITAGRPLFATAGCRQFRDLDKNSGVHFIEPTPAALMQALSSRIALLQGPAGYDPQLLAYAHQQSWSRAGHAYAALYRNAGGGA